VICMLLALQLILQVDGQTGVQQMLSLQLLQALL
jgi:hypothetical protein